LELEGGIASKRFTFVTGRLLSAAFIMFCPAFAQTTTPITLSNITGMSEAAPVGRPVSLTGTGTLTPFGSAAVSFSGTQDQLTELTQGTFTFSLNRLDSFSVTGSPQSVNRATTLSLPGAITGGTGVFSGATGSVNYTFTYTGKSSSAGSFTLTGSGNITVGQTTTAITLALNGAASVTNALTGPLVANPPGSVSPFGTATVTYTGFGNPPGTPGPIQGALTFTFNATDSFVASFSAVFNLFSNAPTSLPCTITGGTGIFNGATGSLNASFALSPNSTTFTLTGSGSITQPKSASSIVTSVTTANGNSTIAQNTFIVIKGSNLVPASTPASGVIWNTAPSFAAGLMPTQLGGISVTVDNRPAFVYFYCSAATDPACSQDQLNILTPLDNTTGLVPVVVTSGTVSTPPFFANLQPVAPAFLLFDVAGHVAATHLNNTGCAASGLIDCYVGPTSLYPGSSIPAAPGETIVLYAVGFGLPATALVNGSAVQSGSLPVLPVCQIGGTATTPGFAGLSSAGLYQFNLTIPSTAVNGDNTFACTYNGSSTPAGNLITIQR
jgi:uncharacterized protein (TIGR03437 family)